MNTTDTSKINEGTIVIKNAKNLTIVQNWELLIKQNALMHFTSCEIKILDYYFSNVEQKYQESFYYPSSQHSQNFTDKLTLDDIIIVSTDNLNKIEELDYGFNIMLLVIVPIVTLVIIINLKKG